MAKLTRLTADDRDNLVAYLDGELDEQTTRRVESVLAQSNVARTDVEQLARTYELLDMLDTPKASVEFTERTVASIRLDRFKPALSQQRWFQQAKRFGVLSLWTLAMVIAGAAGYYTTQFAVPVVDDQLLNDYPLIQQVDVYSEIGSHDFLDRLSRETGLLEEMRKEAGRESR